MKLPLQLGSLLLVFLFLFSHSHPALAQGGPPVVAFYYAWFDQNTWSSGQSVDLPADLYNSADRAVIERQVAQAQSAGINAFVQAWYGPQEANNQTETNFRTLLDVAGARGFQAGISFETTGPFFGSASSVTNALSTLLATHVQHPAYLRYQGKPVIFFWRQQQYSVDQWAAIRQQVDPNHNTFWIAEGTDLAYQAVFDGHYLYSIAWAASPAGELAKWGNRVRDWAAQKQTSRLWVATVMPGYNDTRLPRANAFVVSRRNGDYYRETWQGAVASQPNMIVITSFNEWPEGTHIEPSAGYGNLYLDITRELAGAQPGGLSPAPVSAQIQASAPNDTPTPSATLSGPYLQAVEGANIRSGPGTDFDRLGQLAANSPIAIIGKTAAGDWWQINFPRGSDSPGWVAGEVVEVVGDTAAVPVVEIALPAATVNVTAPLTATAATPALSVVKIPVGGSNVRSGPGLDFDLLGRLEAGIQAVVTGKDDSGQWWEIEYKEGQNGRAWVADAVVDFNGDAASIPVAPGPDRPTPTLTVTPTPTVPPSPTITPTPTPTEPIIAGTIEVTEPINVRAKPSSEGDLLGGLYQGDKAEVRAVSQDGKWWLINFAGVPEGVGWVNYEFVRFQGDKTAVPIFGLGTVTPTPVSTNTPTATPKLPTFSELPTLAPTATSIYQPTAAALLAQRGTPDPSLTELPAESHSTFSWADLPWGVISLILIAVFLWYQFSRRKAR